MRKMRLFKKLIDRFRWEYDYYEKEREFDGEKYIQRIPFYRYNTYRGIVEKNTWAFDFDGKYVVWERLTPEEAKIWFKHYEEEGDEENGEKN